MSLNPKQLESLLASYILPKIREDVFTTNSLFQAWKLKDLDVGDYYPWSLEDKEDAS